MPAMIKGLSNRYRYECKHWYFAILLKRVVHITSTPGVLVEGGLPIMYVNCPSYIQMMVEWKLSRISLKIPTPKLTIIYGPLHLHDLMFVQK